MKEIKCKVSCEGYFAGPIFSIKSDVNIQKESGFDVDEQKNLFENARNTLIALVEHKKDSKENDAIGKTVSALLNDASFLNRVMINLENDACSASLAVWNAASSICDELNQVQDELIRSRTDDIRGMALKLIHILEGKNEKPTKPCAIVSRQLSPAMISSMDEEFLGAFLSAEGSLTSHASIIAESLDIPYLYGSEEAVVEAFDASFIIIDSEKESIILDPSKEEREKALEKMAKLINEKIEEKNKALPQTKDLTNSVTKIYANIKGPEDLDDLIKSGADGVGLFRTEFMFMANREAYTEEEQRKIYCRVLEAMQGKEVVIRTMDIGSDKTVSWLKLPKENNPALGMRGIRVSLEQEDVFMIQLRALLRAATSGNLKILFPMITSEWEVDAIKTCIKKAERELKQEGLDYKVPPIGIMIETPAAVAIASNLAKKVDFFSIGTNDLTQYTLALDRDAYGLERFFDGEHEAVYRFIEMTVEQAHACDVNTSVCGMLAANPKAVKRLILADVDTLSVPVNKVLQTRMNVVKAEREIELERCNAKQV